MDDAYGARLARLAADAGLTVVTVSPAGNEQRRLARRRPRVHTDRAARSRCAAPAASPSPRGTLLPGAFNVDNAALAVVALVAAGVDPAAAAAGVAGVPGRAGAMERVETAGRFLALVDYAHSPDSLERLLVTARGLREPGGRLIVVVRGRR